MKKIKVLCLFRDQYPHIKPVEQYLDSQATFIYDADWKPENIIVHQPDLVIGINEFHLDIARCYEQAKILNIPTLTLQDGILEWRFLFENPVYNGNETGVPMHHPVLADKYACIGPFLADVIGSLGNIQVVEVTGMPKMDSLLNIPVEKQVNAKKKILILTSSKPWFYDDQKPVLVKSLRDLKKFFDTRPELEPVWRITKGLEETLGVVNHYRQKDTQELKSQLQEVDAVITTISTTILEAFLMQKPVCALDYFNTPCFAPTVWKITGNDQIADTVTGLMNPTLAQVWLQEVYKDWLIRTDKSAAETVGKLILAMIAFRKNSPDKPFPANMVNYSGIKFSVPSPDPQDFYPQRETFRQDDREWLKLKLIRAERENAAMRKELSKRSLGGIILLIYHKLHRMILRK